MLQLLTIKEYAAREEIAQSTAYKRLTKLNTLKHKNIEFVVETHTPQTPQLKQIEVEKVVENPINSQLEEKIEILECALVEKDDLIFNQLKVTFISTIIILSLAETLLYFIR